MVPSVVGQSGLLTGLSQEFAVILGAVLGVAGGLVRLRYRNRNSRRRLRQALHSEMTGMIDPVQRTASRLKNRRVSESLELPNDFVVRTAYEANASALGSLSTEEVRAVTEFYSLAVVVQRRIARYEDEASIPLGTAKALRQEIIRLNGELNAAIRAVEENSDVDLGTRPGLDSIRLDESDLEETTARVLDVERPGTD